MALKYTTVQDFWKFLGINDSTSNYQPGEKPEKELVAVTPVTAGDYYLKLSNVNSDTLILYADSTQLTETTHYTFDSDKSKITITADGETALSNKNLEADYEYCNENLSYNESVSILEQAEKRLEKECNCVFADQSSSSPDYKQLFNELLQGKGSCDSIYQTRWNPIIQLQTMVDGDFTTGNTSITLADASGFPSSGTIYIGGNKVTYTNKTSNTITVPSSTPSISDGAVVRGEVVEVSTSPQGVDPTYHVLTPNSDYAIDYDTGEIQLMDNYYFAEDTWLDNPENGVFDRVRVNYCHAYHDVSETAEIPNDIKEAVYMMASRNTVQRTILKSLVGQRDNFNAQSYGFSKQDVEDILNKYRIYHISNV